MTHTTLAPSPDCLFQQVWAGARDLAFLTSSQAMLTLPGQGLTLRVAELRLLSPNIL